MKVLLGSPIADRSIMDLLSRTLARLGVKKNRESETGSNTPEQRREILDRAAATPGIEEGSVRADAAYARYVKGLESGEFSRSPRSASQPRH